MAGPATVGSIRTGSPVIASRGGGMNSLRVMVGGREGGIRAPISREEYSLGTFGSALTVGNILQNRIPGTFNETGRPNVFQSLQDGSFRSVKLFGFGRTRIPERGNDGGIASNSRPFLKSITPELNSALAATRNRTPEPRGSARFDLANIRPNNSRKDAAKPNALARLGVLFLGVPRRIVRDRQSEDDAEEKKTKAKVKIPAAASVVEQATNPQFKAEPAVQLAPQQIELNSGNFLQAVSQSQRQVAEAIMHLQAYLRLQPDLGPGLQVVPAVDTQPQTQAGPATSSEASSEQKTGLKVVQMVRERVQKMIRIKTIKQEKIQNKDEQGQASRPVFAEYAEPVNRARLHTLFAAFDQEVKVLAGKAGVLGRKLGKRVVEIANLLSKANASPLLDQIGKGDKLDGTAVRIEEKLSAQESLTRQVIADSVYEEPALQQTEVKPLRSATPKELNNVVTLPHEPPDGSVNAFIMMREEQAEVVKREDSAISERLGIAMDDLPNLGSLVSVEPERNDQAAASPVVFPPLTFSGILRNPLGFLANNRIEIRREELVLNR